MTSADLLLPTASSSETRRALADLGRPHRLLALTTLLVLVAATGIGLLGPALLGYIVNLVVDRKPPGALTLPVVALVLVAVGQAILGALGDVLTARLGETMLSGLREQVVERTLDLPLEQIERSGSGDLIARVTGDVSVIADAVRSALPELTAAGLTVCLTFVGLLALDWRLALAAACALPIQLHTLRWYLRRSGPIYHDERVAEGARAQQLYESVDGAATIRAYRIADRHAGLVAERSLAAVDLSLAAVRMRTRLFGRLNVAELVGLTAVLGTGFTLVRADMVTVGAATAAALYFHRLFDPVNALLALADDAQSAAAAAARLIGIAQLPVAPRPDEPHPPGDASIVARRLRHSYLPGHEVLRGVDLDVAPGEHLALIGASGAGKTTLAKLIAGIHQPSAGEILIGGRQHNELERLPGRPTVVMVTQETHVFAGTLADDLRLARPSAADEELEAALARAGADWLDSMPARLDTPIGDGGHRLTPTQAQQLALARLALVDPPIAILDEATADAGSAGARTLERAARHILRHRTALIVAHRLNQAIHANQIAVLDNGALAEHGTHQTLVRRKGVYAELWSAWTASR